MRERWFGATGRRVPELALEGSLDVEGALVLDDVTDPTRLQQGARAGDAGRRAGGDAGGGEGGARPAGGREVLVPTEELLALDLTTLTYG